MPLIISCLGRERKLCAAELAAVLALHGEHPRFDGPPGEVALVDTKRVIGWDTLRHELGGSVKLGEATWLGERSLHEVVDETVDDFLTSAHGGGRLTFGVSVYCTESEPRSGKALMGIRSDLERHVKRRHTAGGSSARFVADAEHPRALSSAQVAANRLDGEGLELLICVDGEGRAVAVGRTRAVQPIEDYVEQDRARGETRFREGVLPQKLARILVNLARTPGCRTVLDPFCGAGTIAAQAVLLGLEPIASDRDTEAVEATRAYLARLRPQGARARVETFDARELSRHVQPLSVDALATEPYLGPPLRGRPSVEQATELANECRALYSAALAEARTVLRPGARAVWIAPAWSCAGRTVRTPLARELYLMGFSPVKPCVAWGDGAATLTYHRPGQHVRREIHVLQNPGGG